LNIVEGVEGVVIEGEEKPEEQSAESRLVIRLHCKFGEFAPHSPVPPAGLCTYIVSLQGVIKTHKLYLNQPPVILAPALPQQRASRVTVGPRAMRDLLEHFGRRADAQLQWMFNDDEVRVRSLERDSDNQGI
jgi:hypothetical protein